MDKNNRYSLSIPINRNDGEGTKTKTDLRIFQIEKQIMSFVVKYGERTITLQNDGNEPIDMSVIEFVCHSLDEDGLSFRYSIYNKMLDDARKHEWMPEFEAKRFFLSSPDLNVCLTASDILNDRYQLSKIYSEAELIPKEGYYIGSMLWHLMLDYKMCVVDDGIDKLHKMLHDEETLKSTERCTEIMGRYKKLKEIQRKIANRLNG